MSQQQDAVIILSNAALNQQNQYRNQSTVWGFEKIDIDVYKCSLCSVFNVKRYWNLS